MKTTRIRRLLILPELLMFMANGTFRVIGSGLPKEARLVQTTIDPMTGMIQLFVESAEFDEVELGFPPPIHPAPVFERVEG